MYGCFWRDGQQTRACTCTAVLGGTGSRHAHAHKGLTCTAGFGGTGSRHAGAAMASNAQTPLICLHTFMLEPAHVCAGIYPIMHTHTLKNTTPHARACVNTLTHAHARLHTRVLTCMHTHAHAFAHISADAHAHTCHTHELCTRVLMRMHAYAGQGCGRLQRAE